MKPIEINIAWQGKSDCSSCSIRDSVLFAELNEDDFSNIHAPIDDIHYQPDSIIYKQGDNGEFLYTLREGYIKLLHLNEDGTERIVRLIKQGDLFGMEALLGNAYEHAAIALRPIYLCKIPVGVLKSLGEQSPRLHRQMLKKWGEALSESQTWFSELNTGRVEIRLARFLLRLVKEVDGKLMTPLFKREDMGLMMDVKLETISRALTAMSEAGLISEVGRTSVVINNIDQLKNFCQQGFPSHI
jgi:CRP-like cAMP-binding protein